MASPDKIVADIIRNRFFEGSEGNRASGDPKLLHFRFRMVLVFVAESRGHFDEIDGGFPVHGSKNGVGEIDPRAGVSRAAVEEAVCLGVIIEPQGNLGGVFDIDEVAVLLAIAIIGTMRLEERKSARLLNELDGLVNDGAHVAFVIFAGAEDIEVF